MHESEDPLSQIERQIWTFLKMHQGFISLVQPANLIEDLEDAHRKSQRAEADLPEVQLRHAGGLAHGLSTSCSSIVQQTWRLEIATATPNARSDEPGLMGINRIKWEAMRAMIAAIDRRLDLDFVKDVRLTESTDQDVRIAQDQIVVMRGWITLLPITVQSVFRTADLSPLGR